MKTLKWGIIGTGRIANSMAEALASVDGAVISAVLSRSMNSADKFADKYNIPHRFDEREAFVASQEIDVVYIASPHTQHLEDALLCIRANKNVLCEKPMGLNNKQVNTMLEAAKQHGVFLMEAMWTHFFPAVKEAVRLIKDGAIGSIRQIDARFCFKGEWQPKDRWLNPNLGGGALLDVGIYTIFLSQLLMNEMPVNILADASIGETGIDEQSAYILRYKNGALATLTSGVYTETKTDAVIYGSDGYIELPTFWQPDSLILHKDGIDKTMNFERLGNGYSFEAAAVQEYIWAGKCESDIVPWARSREVSEILDMIREKIGLVYPGEE